MAKTKRFRSRSKKEREAFLRKKSNKQRVKKQRDQKLEKLPRKFLDPLDMEPLDTTEDQESL